MIIDHREIAEKILEQGNCDFRPCKGCVFDDGRCTIFNAGERDMEKVKQWLKDNPKELPMTNEQKIKELELKLQLNDSNLDNAKLNHSIKQAGIQAEIEELKKPKYELFKPEFRQNYTTMSYHGRSRYDQFKSDKMAIYYGNQRKIFDALANFAAHNDPTEKDRAWDGNNVHYIIMLNESDTFTVACKHIRRNVCDIHFSTEELAEAALQMLKNENLI